MACAKHFPGHGDVSVDSHIDLPVINKTFSAIDSVELFPFKKLIRDGIGSVMVAHLSIPSIDDTKKQPTSLSQKTITGLLKNGLGFKGITFTDALEMQAVAKYYPDGDAALQSLIAGNDMLCLPGNIPASIKKIQNAITDGLLSEADINARVKKVLLAKYNMGLNQVKNIDLRNLSYDLNKDVSLIRKAVAENALTVLKLKDSPAILLNSKNKVAVINVGTSYNTTFGKLLQKDFNADVFNFSYSAGSVESDRIINEVKSKYKSVVVGVFNVSKYPSNNFGISKSASQLVSRLQDVAPTFTFVFGNPYAIKNFCDAPNLVACYEDDDIFHQAAFDWFSGKYVARGTLPVTVCEQYKYGAGLGGDDDKKKILPATKDFNLRELSKIDSIANAAIRSHAMPGCVVLVARKGKIEFLKAYGNFTYDKAEPVKTSTIYDLASVTKTSATTVAVMKLYEEGKLKLTDRLGDYLDFTIGSNKSGLIIKEILLHQAGLNPYIPFFKETVDPKGAPREDIYHVLPDNNYSVPVAAGMFMRKDYIDTMYKRIVQSGLSYPGRYVYSDNDFIFLGKVVEKITGMPLNEYVSKTFYQPLGMKTTTFKPFENTPLYLIAPTEREKNFRQQLLHGYVHDPGAAMFGGVAGHAGLFSNAEDLAQLYLMLLNGGEWNGKRYFKKETIDLFTAYNSSVSRRGLGFDKPEKDNLSRKEPYPCLSASSATFGHTGYTGTCVWADPKENLLFIFLSNRVNPVGGSNSLISTLSVRGNMQQAVYNSLNK